MIKQPKHRGISITGVPILATQKQTNALSDKGNISAKSRKKMSKMKIGGYKKSVTRNEEMPVGG